MNRGCEMLRGNPEPGSPRTPAAALGIGPIPSAARERTLTRFDSPSHECSRPRRPQR
jgi:hypothetical protein